MHFLISVIDSSSGSATADEAAEIDRFNDRLKAGGHWVLAGGIASPSESVVIDARRGEPVTSPGPLHETTEFVSGFWIVEAADFEAARALAVGGSAACRRRVELRPLLGLAS